LIVFMCYEKVLSMLLGYREYFVTWWYKLV